MGVRTKAAGLRRASGWMMLAAGGALLVWGAVAWWPRTVDDAFITFRYADNLVAGHGAVYNPGERVEGYTSPSWLLLAAAAIAVGLDPGPVAKVAGLAASLLLLAVLFAALRRAGVDRLGAGAASLLLGSSAVLQMWSVAGLETNAYALLLFAGLAVVVVGAGSARSTLLASTLLVAAALTRPEGLAFWALGLMATIASVPVATGNRRWGRAAALWLAPGLALVGHFAWRLSYYGDLLPNTYYAKTGGGREMWLQGLHGLRSFLLSPAHLLWVLAAAVAAIAATAGSRRRPMAPWMAAAVLLHFAYVISVGDDGLRIHRFHVPVLAPLAFLVGLLFRGADEDDHLRRRPRAGGRPLVLLGTVAVAVSSLASVWWLHARQLPALDRGLLVYQEGNVKLGRHLGSTRDPGTLVAVASAGAVPYYSRLPAIDMYGLNDATIARRPFPARDGGRLMKWDNRYVLSRRPDVIVINRGYFPAGDPMAGRVRSGPGLLAVSPMDRDLFQRVADDGSYGLRPLHFEDGSLFWVFERTVAASGPATRPAAEG